MHWADRAIKTTLLCQGLPQNAQIGVLGHPFGAKRCPILGFSKCLGTWCIWGGHRDTFYCMFILHLGTFWAPFGHLEAPFGTIWPPFGPATNTMLTKGHHFAPFGLHLHPRVSNIYIPGFLTFTSQGFGAQKWSQRWRLGPFLAWEMADD